MYYSEAERALIGEYDAMIIGNQCIIDSSYFKNKPQITQQKYALFIIKYAFETYVRWSPEKMASCLTIDIMREWKVLRFLRYIDFPIELDRKKDLFWVAHLIYPNIIKVKNRDLYLSLYVKVLSGEAKKFPKGYFMDPDGMSKCCVCLKYAIENFCNFTCVEDIYDFFGTPAHIGFLRKYKLSMPVKTLFDSPVTAVHLLMAPEQERNLMFQCYRLNSIYKENLRAKNEQRGVKAIHPHAEIEGGKYVQPKFS